MFWAVSEKALVLKMNKKHLKQSYINKLLTYRLKIIQIVE